jgi:hypothetical protein
LESGKPILIKTFFTELGKQYQQSKIELSNIQKVMNSVKQDILAAEAFSKNNPGDQAARRRVEVLQRWQEDLTRKLDQAQMIISNVELAPRMEALAKQWFNTGQSKVVQRPLANPAESSKALASPYISVAGKLIYSCLF